MRELLAEVGQVALHLPRSDARKMTEDEHPDLGVRRHLPPHAGFGVEVGAETLLRLGHRDVHDQDINARRKLDESRVRSEVSIPCLLSPNNSVEIASADRVAHCTETKL